MVLECKLNFSSRLKSSDKFIIDNYIGNVTLFESNTILSELPVEVLHHDVSHIRLKIKDLG